MDTERGSRRIPLQSIQDCLVASIQIDLTEDILTRFQQELLERIRTSRVHGVILDLSGVDVMDSTDFDQLKSTMTMAAIMGVTPMIVGLKPGLVSALVDLDVDIRGVRAALDLDEALKVLNASDGGTVTAQESKGMDDRGSHQ